MFDAMLATILFVMLFLLGALIWWYLRPKPSPTIPYTDRFPSSNYSYRTFSDIPSFNRDDLSLGGQSREWQMEMAEVGQAIAASHVKHIYFLHGTFVGNDPWGILDSIKVIYPGINKTLAATITNAIKKNTDVLFKDTGNFTARYIDLFANALQSDIPVTNFTWSSGNHHIARLRAAVDLLFDISRKLPQRPTAMDKVLLFGHSHAGQVFALLAHLMDWNELGKPLVEVAITAGYDRYKIYEALRKLSTITIDFVTFGTPMLYSWPDTGYYRLVNIINHRGSSHLAGSVRNILTTKDGDYVQQLALVGTDLLASTAEDRRFNRMLDDYLSSGRNLKAWQSAIKQKMRIPPTGKTFLVNYKDDSKLGPNFHKTFFGHGIYTRYEAMLFNSRLIASTLYSGLT